MKKTKTKREFRCSPRVQKVLDAKDLEIAKLTEELSAANMLIKNITKKEDEQE